MNQSCEKLLTYRYFYLSKAIPNILIHLKYKMDLDFWDYFQSKTEEMRYPTNSRDVDRTACCACIKSSLLYTCARRQLC